MTGTLEGQQAIQEAYERAQRVKAAHEAELLAKPNVVGVGIGLRERDGARTNTVAIVVLVARKLPRHMLRPDEIIEAEIDGVPVDVQEVGKLTAE